jgi:MFS family permease
MKNTEKESQIISGPLDIHGILALAGIVGPLVLVALDLTAAFAVPNYDIIRDTISSLALTSMGWIQTIGFLVIGLLIEIFTAGLFLNIKRQRGFGFGILLLALFGFGMLLIGAFRTDPVGVPATVNGRIHLVGAYGVLGLFPVAVALLLSSIRNDPRWHSMFYYSAVTGVIAFGLAVGHLFLPHLSWFGLYERLTVANAIAWVEVSAVWLLLLSLQRRREAETADSVPEERNTSISYPG